MNLTDAVSSKPFSLQKNERVMKTLNCLVPTTFRDLLVIISSLPQNGAFVAANTNSVYEFLYLQLKLVNGYLHKLNLKNSRKIGDKNNNVF